MKRLAILLAVGISMSACADELLITTLSYHSHPSYTQWVGTDRQYFDQEMHVHPLTVPVTHRYNDLNFGIGYRFDNGFALGYYYNSFERNTFYAGKEFMFTDRWGIMALGATGYGPEMGHKISFIGGPEYKLPLNNEWKLNILGVPPIGKMTGVVNLTLSRKLDFLK